jgi:hypothetical protein
MNSGEVSITPYGDTKSNKRYLKMANRDAGAIKEALGNVKTEYDVTESIMNKDFIIEYNKSTIIPHYNGLNKDGLDQIVIGTIIPGKRIAIHEGTHMAHRRALEDLINKDPEFVERFEANYKALKLKDKRIPIAQVINKIQNLAKKIGNDNYESKDKSQEILFKMWDENIEFLESFANRHAGMPMRLGNSMGYAAAAALGTISYGTVATIINDVIELNNHMNVSDIVQTYPIYVAGPIAAVAIGTFMFANSVPAFASMVKNRNEKGLVPSYLNKEIKRCGK